MNRCALVTGGSGFLGSFVVRDLLADGFESVIALMRGSDPEKALALDYAHENCDALSGTLSSAVESAVSTLQDMDVWFVDYVRSELSR